MLAGMEIGGSFLSLGWNVPGHLNPAIREHIDDFARRQDDLAPVKNIASMKRDASPLQLRFYALCVPVLLNSARAP
jgi:hypothetical protein